MMEVLRVICDDLVYGWYDNEVWEFRVLEMAREMSMARSE